MRPPRRQKPRGSASPLALAHLERLGLLGPHVALAHAVHLSGGDVEILGERRVLVVHNPWPTSASAPGSGA
jgi:cytosine/adenosine deaminase-related metal-dependent hydrolase